MSAHPLPIRLGPQGRLVVPAELRRELGLVDGSELSIRAEGQRLILEPKSEVLRRARSRFVSVTEGLAEELSTERRAQARADEDT